MAHSGIRLATYACGTYFYIRVLTVSLLRSRILRLRSGAVNYVVYRFI
jgi:hypothetical protein